MSWRLSRIKPHLWMTKLNPEVCTYKGIVCSVRMELISITFINKMNTYFYNLVANRNNNIKAMRHTIRYIESSECKSVMEVSL